MNDHLTEVARLPVPGDRHALHGNRLLVGADNKRAHALAIVDLADPRVLATVAYKHGVAALAVVGDLAYVFERQRAIHFARLTGEPLGAADDCYLMMKKDVYQAHPLGNYLVCSRNWQGVSVFDVADPAQPRETAEYKLGERFCERIAIAGERIFAAAGADGLVELRIGPGGTLVEVARLLGGDDGFDVDRAHVVGDTLWVFGNGALPYEQDDDEEGDDEPDCVAFALSDLTTPLWFGNCGERPMQLHALPDGGAIAVQPYKCWRYPRAGKPKLMFKHDLDVETWTVHRGRLCIQLKDELVIYAIRSSSPLTGLSAGPGRA